MMESSLVLCNHCQHIISSSDSIDKPLIMQDGEGDLSLGDVFTVCLGLWCTAFIIPIFHSRNPRVHQHPRRPSQHTLGALTNQRKVTPFPMSKSASLAHIRSGLTICTAIWSFSQTATHFLSSIQMECSTSSGILYRLESRDST